MICELCCKKEAFVNCFDCDIPLCEDCVKIDIFGTGCGCIGPIYMCRECFKHWVPAGVDVDSYKPFQD